jgi:hypothetical protein
MLPAVLRLHCFENVDLPFAIAHAVDENKPRTLLHETLIFTSVACPPTCAGTIALMEPSV